VPRVLVVEDDPDIAQLVARYLEKSGFSVETLANGRAALAAVAAHPPDLLVLDLMLPQVDGLEICRVVRGNEATAAIPIIMLTARAEESDRIVGLEIGADDYLAKPFSPNELVARVRALLRRAQRAAPASAHGTAAGKPMAYGSNRDRSRTPHNHRRGHGRDADGEGVHAPRVPAAASRSSAFARRAAHRRLGLTATTGGTRTVDVHVRRLREKLPLLSKALTTVKQFGYKLLDSPDATD